QGEKRKYETQHRFLLQNEECKTSTLIPPPVDWQSPSRFLLMLTSKEAAQPGVGSIPVEFFAFANPSATAACSGSLCPFFAVAFALISKRQDPVMGWSGRAPAPPV